ncbi:hypothetical protein AYI70_g56 [Smittium culicis]|uniref:Uncharacterized protein n=1 Tax=Smittium culicis TaxID=133412 RepID=A0A1R1YIF6_9FUNG|nr:hypothetical protein AYI70_g56 [Smittium culicis]
MVSNDKFSRSSCTSISMCFNSSDVYTTFNKPSLVFRNSIPSFMKNFLAVWITSLSVFMDSPLRDLNIPLKIGSLLSGISSAVRTGRDRKSAAPLYFPDRWRIS